MIKRPVGDEVLHGHGVIACSALKRSYRERILAGAPNTFFIHLDGSREILAQRLGNRTGHFMPATLLDSQLATLEPIGSDEPGAVIDIDQPISLIIALAQALIKR